MSALHPPTKIAVVIATCNRFRMLAERSLPGLAELAERIAGAHAAERCVAIHCVTRAELWLACAAFEEARVRAGDRIEHAAVAPPEAARSHFRRLRELRDRFGLAELSMGMTDDFEVAIEEGATIVRVGRAIFGAREG